MIKKAVSLSAYAKINLHLEVLNRRNDGFHDIVSVFQLISLADELLIEKIPEQNICRILSPLADLPEDNTITKAYMEFQKLTGIDSGVNVRLLKHIPIGAGLGGGSSDAAAVLLGLNDLFNAGLSAETLKNTALNIGSDVPFFLQTSSAIVEGRGEILKTIDIDTDYFGVLIFPDIVSSTKEAYSLLKRENKRTVQRFNPEDFCSMDCKNWPFFNSFEDTLFNKYPEIKKVKLDLLDYGADFALMSGSGSSVFGLFKDENAAKTAFLELFKQNKYCFLFFALAL